MGDRRLVVVGAEPQTQTFGDVLHALAQVDKHAVKGLEKVARWRLAQLQDAPAPEPLRAKHHLAKAVLREPALPKETRK